MENFFTRYKNPLVLMAVLVIQVIGLATQVKRPDPSRRAGGGPRLIRVWTVTALTPFERALVATGHFFRNTWHDYIDLHNVSRRNRELQREIERMRLEQVRLRNNAAQSRRLQALLDFKEHYVGQTLAAQVIATSGSDLLHVITIDKGSLAGVRPDMAVITPDGIVGKVKEVFPLSSQVLMINDRESGAGVILENSRLQGIVHGKELGGLRVNDVMSDEKVEVGERVITSGGDRVYPKGLPVGTVTAVGPDPDASPFLAITVRPAADLNRLEEVLVVTRIAEEAPAPIPEEAQQRAADILAQRLPSVPKKAEDQGDTDAAKAGPIATGAVKKQNAAQKNAATQPALKPVLKKAEGDAAVAVKAGPTATSTLKKQTAPQKSSGAVPSQRADQAQPAPKKPAGAGPVETGGAGPQASPSATPIPTQPPAGDAEKPPR